MVLPYYYYSYSTITITITITCNSTITIKNNLLFAFNMNPIHDSSSSSDLVWKSDGVGSDASSSSSPASKRIEADAPVIDCKIQVLKVVCIPCNYIWRRRAYIIDTFADVVHILMIVLCCSNDDEVRMRHDDFTKKKTEGIFDDKE